MVINIFRFFHVKHFSIVLGEQTKLGENEQKACFDIRTLVDAGIHRDNISTTSTTLSPLDVV